MRIALLAGLLAATMLGCDDNKGVLPPRPPQSATLPMCTEVGERYTPINATDSFPDGVKEIFATFTLADAEKGDAKKLTSKWIAVDVGDKAPANTEIATADMDLNGMDRGQLKFTLPRPIPNGKYRLDVSIDGKPWKSTGFTVGEKK